MSRAAGSLPPLAEGDRLDQPTFHERYEAMPDGTRVELVGGVVRFPPPRTSLLVGRAAVRVPDWLAEYDLVTAGVEALPRVTLILGGDSEVEPTANLRRLDGPCRERHDGYLAGPPELVVEVAAATESYALNAKPADYERHGVLECLVLVVRTREPAWFRRVGERLVRQPADADGLFRSQAFPGLWLDATALFADDGKRVRAVLKRGLASPEHKAFAAKLAGPKPARGKPGRRAKR